MIATILLTILGVHIFWALVVIGSLWWMSRDPKPSGVLPFPRRPA